MNDPLVKPADKLTLVELERICTCVRVCRLQVDRQMMELQERIRVHADGHAHEALLHLENDMFLTGSALRKLDRMVREYKP